MSHRDVQPVLWCDTPDSVPPDTAVVEAESLTGAAVEALAGSDMVVGPGTVVEGAWVDTAAVVAAALD